MRSGNTKYNSVLSKLHAQYNCGTDQIVDHPEYLKSVLKEVYKHDYNAIIDEISLETDTLNDVDEFKAEFFKFMKS